MRAASSWASRPSRRSRCLELSQRRVRLKVESIEVYQSTILQRLGGYDFDAFLAAIR